MLAEKLPPVPSVELKTSNTQITVVDELFKLSVPVLESLDVNDRILAGKAIHTLVSKHGTVADELLDRSLPIEARMEGFRIRVAEKLKELASAAKVGSNPDLSELGKHYDMLADAAEQAKIIGVDIKKWAQRDDQADGDLWISRLKHSTLPQASKFNCQPEMFVEAVERGSLVLNPLQLAQGKQYISSLVHKWSRELQSSSHRIEKEAAIFQILKYSNLEKRLKDFQDGKGRLATPAEHRRSYEPASVTTYRKSLSQPLCEHLVKKIAAGKIDPQAAAQRMYEHNGNAGRAQLLNKLAQQFAQAKSSESMVGSLFRKLNTRTNANLEKACVILLNDGGKIAGSNS